MRIARLVAVLTFALGTLVPAHAHAATPTPTLPVAPVDAVGGVAGGALTVVDMVASCQHRLLHCVVGRPF
jgi:hypothetical protein